MNPDDAKREVLIRFLYKRHKTAPGVKATAIGQRDLQREMKKVSGMKQSDVVHNLDYLVQVGWVVQVVNPRAITTPSGMHVSSEQVLYKISAVGIEHMEAATAYVQPASLQRVNITNINGVTVVGDGNVVSTRYADVPALLDRVEAAIAATKEISEDQRLDALSDIGTMRSLMAKPTPDRGIIEKVFASLAKLADVATLAPLVSELAARVLPLPT